MYHRLQALDDGMDLIKPGKHHGRHFTLLEGLEENRSPQEAKGREG